VGRKNFAQNLNIAEKLCLLISFYVAVFIIYVCICHVSNFIFGTTETVNIKSAMTISLSATLMFLVMILLNDWLKKYVVETLDKDLREIKVLANEVNFRIKRFPYSESKSDKKQKEEFYQFYWKLRTMSSKIKSFNVEDLVVNLDHYLDESFHLMDEILVKKENVDFDIVTQRAEKSFNILNLKIDEARKGNLKP